MDEYRDQQNCGELLNVLEGVLASVDGLIAIIDKDHRVLISNWKGHPHLKSDDIIHKGHCFEIFKQRTTPCEYCPPMDAFIDGKTRVYEDRNPVDGRFKRIQVTPIFNDQGEVSKVLEYVKDITDQKKAAEILKQSKGQYTGLFDYSNDAIIIHDSGGTILEVNQKALNQFAYTKNDFLKLSVKDILSPQGLEKLDWAIEQAIKTGYVTCEIEFLNKHGRAFPAQLTSNRHEFGNDVIIQSLILDISDRKQIEKQKSELESQLTQALKMEALGRMAAGVVHDLNNLLVPILGYSEMIAQECIEDDSRDHAIKEIHNAGQDAKDIIQQLLAFCRKQPAEFKQLNINHKIRDIKKLLRKTIRENIEIEYNLASEIPSIFADNIQLDQVIINLAVNAQDAMPSGGTLRIETKASNVDEVKYRSTGGPTPGHYVAMEISDSGCGIGDNNISKIFDPFFTTKEKGGGTGLGLSTVYGIVKQHNGHITVKSAPEEGSIFRLYFPAKEGSALEIRKSSKIHLPEHTGSISVLVVEDSDIVRDLTVNILKRHDYKVISAAGPKECLKLLSENTLDFDLLLTDVVMPGMNGIELFCKLREKKTNLKVLFMTGYSEDVLNHQGISIDGYGVLRKPFSVNDLLAKIQSLFAI